MIIILMGVSGCGKTTIGKQLAKDKNLPFFDADDFHPEYNVNKMKKNIPLTDEDRWPWLNVLSDKIQFWENNGGAVLACSALKESYRSILSVNEIHIFWVFLFGSFHLINDRIEKRNNHYMNSNLLKSQFDTLEVPQYGLHINIEKSVQDILFEINSKLNSNE